MKSTVIGFSTPGIKKKTFVIHLTEPWYKKNDILDFPDGSQVRVTKVYKYNWYRKILNFFGFKFKWFDCVLVKII